MSGKSHADRNVFPRKKMGPVEKIGLGGGCHWCTEGIFQMLTGVARVEQGFIRSDPPSDTWAEGVIVHFHPSVIDLSMLIEVHLRTHNATARYVPGSKYRGAV
ncbi:MAG TPA: peptide-methionine (S)-S-oxide reductase, partial [Sphingomicrobium sp.]|nr:peptide-methionine (S)-S-oxide reductase [Sphingomicrobium sp.]